MFKPIFGLLDIPDEKSDWKVPVRHYQTTACELQKVDSYVAKLEELVDKTISAAQQRSMTSAPVCVFTPPGTGMWHVCVWLSDP